jgi:hypothetical protein
MTGRDCISQFQFWPVSASEVDSEVLRRDHISDIVARITEVEEQPVLSVHCGEKYRTEIDLATPLSVVKGLKCIGSMHSLYFNLKLNSCEFYFMLEFF